MSMFVGLILILNIEQDMYPWNLSSQMDRAVGAKVTVHDNELMPFPELNGISVAPNTETNIRFDQVCGNLFPAGFCYRNVMRMELKIVVEK